MSSTVFEAVMRDYRSALTQYRADAQRFFVGSMFSLELKQTIKRQVPLFGQKASMNKFVASLGFANRGFNAVLMAMLA